MSANTSMRQSERDLTQTLLDNIESKYGLLSARKMEQAFSNEDKQIKEAMGTGGMRAEHIAQTEGIDLSQFSANKSAQPEQLAPQTPQMAAPQQLQQPQQPQQPGQNPLQGLGNILKGLYPILAIPDSMQMGMDLRNQRAQNNRVMTPEEAAKAYAYAQSIAPPGTIPDQSAEGRISYKQAPGAKFIGNLGDVSNKTPDQVKLELEQKDPAYAKLLQNINDGKYDLGSRSTNQSLKIVEDAGLLYPDLDLSTARARYKIRQGFTSGKEAGLIRNFNTAINHATQALELIPVLKNEGFKQGNRLKNFTSRQVGKPGVARFNLVKNALSGELGSIFKNTGATDQEIGNIEKSIDTSDSPENLTDVIHGAIDLMVGRMDSMDNQWKSAFGNDSSFEKLYSTSTKRNLQKLGIKSDFGANASQDIVAQMGYDPNKWEVVENG